MKKFYILSALLATFMLAAIAGQQLVSKLDKNSSGSKKTPEIERALSQKKQVNSNGHILFFRSSGPGRGDLFLMDQAGKNLRKIGQSGSRPDHYPNWSPDGKYITFESYRKNGWRIWVMNADGSKAKKILDDRSGTSTYEFDPSFSSDGKRIFFVSNGDIFSVHKDGTGLNQITHTPDVFESSPFQSPDGKNLVFVADGQIHVMDSDGNNRLNLTDDRQVVAGAPTWSPDGKRILFYSTKRGSYELYVMNTDGTEKRFLLDEKEMDSLGFSTSPYVDPWDNNWGATEQYKASFSRDGQKIAFSREVNGNREIFSVNFDGTGIQQLTNNSVFDGFPMWQP